MAQFRHPNSCTGGSIKTHVRPDAQPGTFPKGRRCRTCAAYLSIYNPATTCFCHTPRQPVKFSGAMDNRLDVISAQELFSEVA